jgi:hypothetical protein
MTLTIQYWRHSKIEINILIFETSFYYIIDNHLKYTSDIVYLLT